MHVAKTTWAASSPPPATRGHGFSYELSHCVIPKELSAAAARHHVPRMWALDPAQKAGRKGEVQRGAGVSAWGRNRPDDLARQPVTQLLLATVLSGSEAAKQRRESLMESEREEKEEGGGCILQNLALALVHFFSFFAATIPLYSRLSRSVANEYDHLIL